MKEKSYLMPLVSQELTTGFKWRAVVKFSKLTLLLMLFLTVLFVVFLVAVAVFFVRLAITDNLLAGPGWTLYFVATSLGSLYLSVRMTQSIVRLSLFLRRRGVQ